MRVADGDLAAMREFRQEGCGMNGGRRKDLPPADDSMPDAGLDGAGEAPPNVLQDWVTLWQSELAAIATDREVQENWQALLALWAATANAMVRPLAPARRADGTHRRPGTAAAKRAAAAAAASDPRDVEIDRLHDRIADLERRLDQLERGNGGAVGRDERRRGAR